MQSLFGEICPACCGPTIGGLCTHCRATLRRIDDPCHRCGLPQPVANCPRRRQRWSIAAVTAPFAYEEPLDHYVRRLKYSGSRSLGRAFGLMLAADLETAARSIDAIVAGAAAPAATARAGFQSSRRDRSNNRCRDRSAMVRSRHPPAPCQSGSNRPGACQPSCPCCSCVRRHARLAWREDRDRRRRADDGRDRKCAWRCASCGGGSPL